MFRRLLILVIQLYLSPIGPILLDDVDAVGLLIKSRGPHKPTLT